MRAGCALLGERRRRSAWAALTAIGLLSGCAGGTGAATPAGGPVTGQERPGPTLLAAPVTAPSASASAATQVPPTTWPGAAPSHSTTAAASTTATTAPGTVPAVSASTSVAATTTTSLGERPAVTTAPSLTTSTGARPWVVGSAPAIAPRTSCRQVAHIGDSTSEHLWEAATVGGGPEATMEARYRAIGVDEVFDDSSGGRSMVERLDRHQRNAIEVAEEVRAGGFRGCWVLMIGTNDAANVAAGARIGLTERIESMLAVIAGDPVLWVNVSSASSIPFYGHEEMAAFNAALADAAARHPNLRVFDWAAVVQPEWYGPDDLHNGPAGRAWRTALTAQELAWAFPG